MSKYIPRILLCGDADNFLSKNFAQIVKNDEPNCSAASKAVTDNFLSKNPMQVEIVGQIELDEQKTLPFDALKPILDGEIDYLVFDDAAKLAIHADELISHGLNERFITCDGLSKHANQNFFAPSNAATLTKLIRRQKVSKLLDVDNFFARNDFFCDTNGLEVDGINVDTKNFPFATNFYRKIFPSLEKCSLQTYDALILSAERDADEIFDEIVATDDLSDKIFVFARKNSALEGWFNENSVAFAEIFAQNAVNGSWIFLRKRTTPENFNFYSAGDELPDGENIDDLERYLGDLTAIYRLWKNSTQKIIGFASKNDFSLPDDVENLLRDCDLIISRENLCGMTNHERQMQICGEYLTAHVEKIFRKHIKRTQNDFLAAFDFVNDSYNAFSPDFFVTRRKIFDSYCAWLFSFLLDATNEVLSTTNLSAVSNPQKYRVVELTARRLPTVWLAKNNFLRLKEVV